MWTVEKVARALCEADNLDPDETDPADISGKRLPYWRRYVPRAVAAIEAMREPIEAIRTDGSDEMKNSSEVWRAMIDAILAEGT